MLSSLHDRWLISPLFSICLSAKLSVPASQSIQSLRSHSLPAYKPTVSFCRKFAFGKAILFKWTEALALQRTRAFVWLQRRHELAPQKNQRIVWCFFHVKESSKKQLKTIHVVLWLYLVGLGCCYVYKPVYKRMLMCISCHSMCLHDQLLLWWCIKIHNACRKMKRISSMQ